MTDRERADLLLDIIATERKLEAALAECTAADDRAWKAWEAAATTTARVTKDISANRDRLIKVMPDSPFGGGLETRLARRARQAAAAEAPTTTYTLDISDNVTVGPVTKAAPSRLE